MSKKLFAFDLDGTILTHGDKYFTSSIEAVKQIKRQNHYAIVATGRPLDDILRIGEDFYKNFDFLVCNNGTYYYDLKTKQKIFDKFLPNEIVQEFFEMGKENDAFFTLHTKDEVFRTSFIFQDKNLEKKIIKNEWQNFTLVDQNKVKKMIEQSSITQASLRSSEEKIQDLFKIFDKKHSSKIKIRISGGSYLDINPLNISKWKGIELICQRLNLDLENVITFGDSGNDVEMLENALKSFALENGTKEAKDVAKEVIGSNLTEAISQTVKRILKENNG